MHKRKYPSPEKKRERKRDGKRSHRHHCHHSSAARWQDKNIGAATRQSNKRESVVAPDFGVAKLFSQFKRLLGREHLITKRVNTPCKQERGRLCVLEMQILWAVPDENVSKKKKNWSARKPRDEVSMTVDNTE